MERQRKCKMKWINNENIKFSRGDYEGLIVKYDDYDMWFCLRAMATQQTQKSEFRRLGQYFGAKTCEVKSMWDENGNAVETNVLAIMSCNNEFRFYIDTPNGLKRIEIEHMPGLPGSRGERNTP